VLFPVLLAAFASCGPGCSPPIDAPAEGREPPPVGDPDGGSAGKQSPPPPPSDEMITDAPGIELSKLSEVQRQTFFQLINTEPSACEKPHSMAKSLHVDTACRDSLILAQFAADSLASGAAVSDVKDALVGLEAALNVREIDVEGRPTYGNQRAPVTVVVFADFECPHCRAEAPGLRQAVQQFRGQAKLVFKHYPLNMHPRAKVAAIACEAAHQQEKFWEMHDIVFGHQTALEDADLEAYAKEIGLDVARWKKDMTAEDVILAVEKDRAWGDKLEIPGTPAVFVNGREVNPALFGGTLEGWIDDALRR
jgi:protein-disulfide isomerase